MAKLSLIALFFLILPLTASALTSEYLNSNSCPIVVEFGLEYLHPKFNPIDQVVIRNPQTSSEAAAVIGGVNQVYPDVFAQKINLQFLLSREKNAKLTFSSFLPLNSLAEMDSGNTYLPEYVLYRTEKQRPRVSAMGEMELSQGLKIGFGLDLGFGVTSEASVFLHSGDGKYSDQRISATVKPRVVPIGVLEYEGYRFLVKGENKVNFSLNASAGANVFPPLNASFEITYSTSSALFFDPWTFDLSRSYPVSLFGLSPVVLGLGASYQLWSGYESRAAVIDHVSGTFSNGLSPSFKSQNLLVPRISIEKGFGIQRWELGYEFKDSIFKDTPRSNGNYLDPPRHTFILGAIFPFSTGWELGANLQVSRLLSQTVIKSDVSEIGATSPLSVGYQASGWLYGGSLNLTVPFEVKKL